MNLSLSTWKGTGSEERAGRQHWGMLGRALCLLPLECPWASYISPGRPSAAPSGHTFTVSGHTRLPLKLSHRPEPVSASLHCREVLWNTVIMDLCNCSMTTPQLIHTQYIRFTSNHYYCLDSLRFCSWTEDMSHKYPVGLTEYIHMYVASHTTCLFTWFSWKIWHKFSPHTQLDFLSCPSYLVAVLEVHLFKYCM